MHEVMRKGAIQRMELALIQSEESVGPDAFPVQHHFAPGQYAREIFIPQGSLIVGKRHVHAHVNILSLGKVMVFSEHFGLQEMQAPYTFVSPPGTKRVIAALEDTIWTTVHVTDKTDLSEIEAELIQEG